MPKEFTLIIMTASKFNLKIKMYINRFNKIYLKNFVIMNKQK